MAAVANRPFLWVLGALALVMVWAIAGYNGLITTRESVSSVWAQVQTQYQRRVDLIPNLVATVKGASRFEQETFREITEARSRWQGAKTRGDQVAAATALDGALGRLLVTFENYPQLQATQAYRDLMTQLEGTENRIAVARKDYNDVVRSYNVRVKRFPGRLLASLFGFSPEPFYEAQAGADKAPSVAF